MDADKVTGVCVAMAMTMKDQDFAERVLQRVREHFPQEYPLSTYQLADIFTQIGMEAKEDGLPFVSMKYLEIGEYLSRYDIAQDLLPPEKPEVPLLLRAWYGLRGKPVYEMPAPIDIVFTAPPGPGNECVFVEVTQGGRSINSKKMTWVDRRDGTVALRLPGHFH